MKTLSATATPIIVVIMMCALSTGGQQPRQTPSPRGPRAAGQTPPSDAISNSQPDDYVCNKVKTTLPASLPASAFPDFNVGSLPPNVMVRFDDQPHPEEITFSRVVSKVPTVRDKLSLLACMAESLQAEVNDLRSKKVDFDTVTNLTGISDTGIRVLEKQSDALAAGVGYLMQQEQMRKLQPSADDLKRQLDDFKAAACPVLRGAARAPRRSWNDVAGTMRDQDVQMKLDSACGLP